MNHFVYIKDILGVKTNLDNFSWVYGSVAPKSNEANFDKCKIKINIEVRKTKDTFDENVSVESLDTYNYFYARNNEKKVYYERDFIFNSKLRYSIEIINNNIINVTVNKNYYKYIKYKFMNLHSLGYILTDIVSGLLLLNGYATLHCSAVKILEKAVVIFAPPSTGKTVTAIKLCENTNAKFIAEDIALTDGKYIYSVPWTSTFRFYNHDKESKIDRFVDVLRKKIPIFQLISIKKKKSIGDYIGEDTFIELSKITDVVILGKGEAIAYEDHEGIFEKIINLNKYEFNYHKSPTMLVMNFFNPEISIDEMYNQEKDIINKLLSVSKTYKVNANNALDYANIIAKTIEK